MWPLDTEVWSELVECWARITYQCFISNLAAILLYYWLRVCLTFEKCWQERDSNQRQEDLSATWTRPSCLRNYLSIVNLHRRARTWKIVKVRSKLMMCRSIILVVKCASYIHTWYSAVMINQIGCESVCGMRDKTIWAEKNRQYVMKYNTCQDLVT
jgi:hypothetical protein